MSILHIRHIEAALRRHFTGLIDLTDARNDTDYKNFFLTRSLAAYSLMNLTHVDPKTASEAITDGYQDNGIDLVYHDQSNRVLYLIQSKWEYTGRKSPESGDILKFIQGVEAIINLEWEAFNPKVCSHKQEIRAAIEDAETQIVLVVCFTGQQPLSPESRRPLDKLIEDLNDTSDLVRLEILNQSLLHQSLLTPQGSIDVEVSLQDWGQSEEPFQAFYGQVEVTSIAEWWDKHRSLLFAENIRNYRGSTDVNEAIANTLETEPDHFFYLNNGLTALCSNITKKPLHGNNRNIGVFDCKGLSIVNGAQTVGSIAAACTKFPDHKGKILVRLISLKDCPEGFGKTVTVATNTQNRVERRDFVALDPEQRRLHDELFLDGKDYAYKSGEQTPSADKGCTLVEATIALACANSDISLAVQAKREIGVLWEDVAKPPYRLRLWRTVEILREIDKALEVEQSERSGRESLIPIHGNRFILHKIFETFDPQTLDNPDINFDPLKSQAGSLVNKVVEILITEGNNVFANSYPATLFKSQSKCKDLDTLIDMSRLVDGSVSLLKQGTLFDDSSFASGH